jgi:hypothetical protein
LGAGISYEVVALTAHDGRLFAGSTVSTMSAANCIAEWDGAAWVSLGSVTPNSFVPAVRALRSWNGVLVAAGNFSAIAGVTASRIAQWDGVRWQPLSGGLGGGMMSPAYALAEHRGTLIVGGAFYTAGGQVSAFWARWGCAAPERCAGDGNCDGVVNWSDIDYLVAGQNDNESAWQQHFADWNPACPFLNLDGNEDGHVNWRDIDPFIARMNMTCP